MYNKQFNIINITYIYNYVVYYWPGPPCLPGKFVYVFVSVKWVFYFKKLHRSKFEYLAGYNPQGTKCLHNTSSAAI